MKRQGSPRGQISLLVVFSLLPMITLFAFVVNIGMLVNSKIALQNAVDLAAYAGAAAQARQMTNISHLNYYARQVYKKFIYKYYVIGNISLKCFPRNNLDPVCKTTNISSKQPFDWINRSAATASAPPASQFPGVPVVCISLSKESNPCQLVTQVPIVQAPPCGGTDPTCGILQQAATSIGGLQQESCAQASLINQAVLLKWLYATSYDTTMANSNLAGLVNADLGMVIEELMIRERIHNIADVVNVGPQTVTTASESALEKGPDPSKYERTIMAFKTLNGNLNQRVFDPDTLTMTELQNPPMLLLNDITPIVETAYANMNPSPGQNPAPGAPIIGCQMMVEKFAANPFVGVVKSPATFVYYAIKGTATAHLLFNPFPIGGTPDTGIELTAYAAAMPFGSRIGPNVMDPKYWTIQTQSTTNPVVTLSQPLLNVDDSGHTSQSTDILAAYFNNLQTDPASTSNPGGPTPGLGTVGTQNMNRGMHTAMLPDEWEIGRYNIPVDNYTQSAKDGSDKEFLPYYRTSIMTGAVDTPYTFWAPIVAIGGVDEFTQHMQTAIESIASISGTVGTGNLATWALNVKTELQGQIGQAMSTLKAANHSMVFPMPDPLSQVYFKLQSAGANNIPVYPPGKISGSFTTQGPILSTSYVTDHDSDYYAIGRDGYSVKMVPFKILLSQPGNVTNDGGSTPWSTITGNQGGEHDELVKVAH